ncbi:MAG TPA: hypothetical protein VGF11_04955 [Acidimicrobiales bacterium]|jgi:hypothetical protein
MAACDVCVSLPTPLQKKSYLVSLVNDKGESLDIIVQTVCTHGMQEWVDSKVFPISNPKVKSIDPYGASHVPIVVNL